MAVGTKYSLDLNPARRPRDSRRLRIDDKDDTTRQQAAAGRTDLAGAGPAGYQEQVGLISSREGSQLLDGRRSSRKMEWVKLGKPQRLGRTC